MSLTSALDNLSQATVLQGVCAIGIAIGSVVAARFVPLQRAVDVVGRVNHYSLLLTLAVVVVVVGVQMYRRRAAD